MPQLIIIVAMFALLWMLLIRPQRVKQQRQRELVDSVAPGDEILTVGGLYGIVQEIDEDDDLIAEIAEGIHVRIARRAVASVVRPDDEEELEDDDGEFEDDDGEFEDDDAVDVDDAPEGGDEAHDDEIWQTPSR